MRILMICLGNICRSPLAEGIARAKIELHDLPWTVDSVGTSGWHIGNPPDPRSIRAAHTNDIDISGLRARQIHNSDLHDFDALITMDAQNYQDVKRLDPAIVSNKIYMMTNFLYPGENRPVPDPYYGDMASFYEVFDLLDASCEAMITFFLNQKK